MDGGKTSGECEHVHTEIEYIEVKIVTENETIIDEREEQVCQKCQRTFHSQLRLWM